MPSLPSPTLEHARRVVDVLKDEEAGTAAILRRRVEALLMWEGEGDPLEYVRSQFSQRDVDALRDEANFLTTMLRANDGREGWWVAEWMQSLLSSIERTAAAKASLSEVVRAAWRATGAEAFDSGKGNG